MIIKNGRFVVIICNKEEIKERFCFAFIFLYICAVIKTMFFINLMSVDGVDFFAGNFWGLKLLIEPTLNMNK